MREIRLTKYLRRLSVGDSTRGSFSDTAVDFQHDSRLPPVGGGL